MKVLSNLQYYIKNPKAGKIRCLQLLGKSLSDEEFIKRMYKIQVGRPLNLVNPQTYTEKLQWLKIYDRRPEYTMMQDKYAVREYVANKIGKEYLIPLLGVWNNANEIDTEKLPDQFVLKCNHDCASVIICRDKKSFDFEQAKKRLNLCLQKNYYESGREWAYKNIKPLILAETFMYNVNEITLTDYKFFCCSGKAKMVLLTFGEAHTPQRRMDFYDMEFKPLPIKRGSMEKTDIKREKPTGFDDLIVLAEKIASDFPFVRVDFYLVDSHPYFGEVAFYPSAGFAEFSPYEWEQKVGSWIELPQHKT